MDTMKDCTVYKTLTIIGKKWTLLILFELDRGSAPYKRFNELKAALDTITPKVLVQRLRELEDDGLVVRRVDTTHIPITSEYALTESGTALLRVVAAIKEWGLAYKFDNEACRCTTCKMCGI